MVRGTTATNIFTTNEDLTNAKVYVSYSQRDRVILEKTNKDMLIERDKITVSLSQIDTLRFSPDVPIYMQIRYVRSNGLSGASNIVKTKIENALKGGVISYG